MLCKAPWSGPRHEQDLESAHSRSVSPNQSSAITKRYKFEGVCHLWMLLIVCTLAGILIAGWFLPPNSNVSSNQDIKLNKMTTNTTLIASHDLIKRHDYTLVCLSPQDPKQPHLGKYDDIPLTKKCAKSPHKYVCDSVGMPDIDTGGKTDRDCDQKCECRNIGTNPKPYCVGILGWGSWNTCI